jgi:hypothetical protein
MLDSKLGRANGAHLKIFVATDQEASTISDFESMILNILPAMKRKKGLSASLSLDTLTSHISRILEDFSTMSPQYQAKNFGGFRSTGAVDSAVGPCHTQIQRMH